MGRGRHTRAPPPLRRPVEPPPRPTPPPGPGRRVKHPLPPPRVRAPVEPPLRLLPRPAPGHGSVTRGDLFASCQHPPPFSPTFRVPAGVFAPPIARGTRGRRPGGGDRDRLLTRRGMNGRGTRYGGFSPVWPWLCLLGSGRPCPRLRGNSIRWTRTWWAEGGGCTFLILASIIDWTGEGSRLGLIGTGTATAAGLSLLVCSASGSRSGSDGWMGRLRRSGCRGGVLLWQAVV